MARAISHSFAALTRKILFLPLEHKIHIFSPPCNILYLPCDLPFKRIKKRRAQSSECVLLVLLAIRSTGYTRNLIKHSTMPCYDSLVWISLTVKSATRSFLSFFGELFPRWSFFVRLSDVAVFPFIVGIRVFGFFKPLVFKVGKVSSCDSPLRSHKYENHDHE